MKARDLLIDHFIATSNWQSATSKPLATDASSRRYWRLSMSMRSAILMDAPPPELPVAQFAQIAQFLSQHGLCAPAIYAQDDKNGLLLLEDLGDDTFTRVLEQNPDTENTLYDLAIDALVQLHQINDISRIALPPYDERTLLKETALFLQWFYPAFAVQIATTKQTRQFNAAWKQCFKSLVPHRSVVVLRDYHVDNLMHIKHKNSDFRCGLLDFQDAVTGSPAYDLMSLIEDARRNISPSLRSRCLNRYFSAIENTRGFPHQESLTPWLNVLAAQRHAKVLGIFVRLSQRDHKSQYLEHLPRVLALLQAALEREPLLSPVADWMNTNLPLSTINLTTID